jgi:DNA-binding protein H-NS
MKQLSSMNFDELLALKGKVEAAISSRVLQERKRLTESLQRLDAFDVKSGSKPRTNGHGKRRTLAPKFRNPAKPSETWAGRGNRPRWLIAALKSGKKLEAFAVK